MIEVGVPDAARLHRAAKAAPQVVVYTHRDSELLMARLAGERIHRGEAMRFRTVDPGLLRALVARLDRRMDFDLAVSDGTLYFTLGDETLTGMLHERTVASA